MEFTSISSGTMNVIELRKEYGQDMYYIYREIFKYFLLDITDFEDVQDCMKSHNVVNFACATEDDGYGNISQMLCDIRRVGVNQRLRADETVFKVEGILTVKYYIFDSVISEISEAIESEMA